MDLAWSALGALGLVAALVAFVLAAFLVAAAPDRAANRRLAAVLVLEGLGVGALNGLSEFVTTLADLRYAYTLGILAFVALPFAYLAFLGTLDTRLTRPVRFRGAVAVLGALAVLAVALAAFRMDAFFRLGADLDQSTAGPLFFVVQYVGAFACLFGLVASVQSYRASPTDLGRQRARAFVLAFGVRDALYALLALYIFVVSHLPPLDLDPSSLLADLLVKPWEPPVITLLYVPLIAYGILRFQLFDIDLKIKRTLVASTVGGAFLAVFFVVTQVAQNYLAQYGVLAGGAAAGLLLFAVTPLQRAVERVANKAMPNTSATPEYLTFKKFEVYRAAFEGVLEDGKVSAKERAMLVALQAKLGIGAADAEALEGDVRADLAAAPA